MPSFDKAPRSLTVAFMDACLYRLIHHLLHQILCQLHWTSTIVSADKLQCCDNRPSRQARNGDTAHWNRKSSRDCRADFPFVPGRCIISV